MRVTQPKLVLTEREGAQRPLLDITLHFSVLIESLLWLEGFKLQLADLQGIALQCDPPRRDASAIAERQLTMRLPADPPPPS